MAGNIAELMDAEFEKVVLNGPLPSVVDFWAPWCGPCVALKPNLEKVAGEYEGRVAFHAINIDNNTAIAARYRVQSIPMLLFIAGGQVRHQIVGNVHPAEIKTAVERLLAAG